MTDPPIITATVDRVRVAPSILVRPVPGWKRTFDLVASIFLLAILAPFLVVIAVYIRSVSHGPAIFTQSRLGRGGKPFRIWKFRTMHLSPNADGEHRAYIQSLSGSEPAAKPSYNSRLIRGGAFIRKWSLDELPQIWNVLTGKMSLIGPRPDVLKLEDYKTDYELRRFEVLPGITGLWQVSGKNSLSYNEMIDLDVCYADKMSCWLDLKIMLMTVRLLANQQNS